MTTPPRTIEVLLASLGAERRLRDAVIGDLAEEFAQRAERDGIRAAKRWYYHEAIRVTPHLLRNWLANLGFSEVLHLVGVLASTWVIALVTLTMAMMSIGSIVAAVTGVRLGQQHISWDKPFVVVLMFVALVVADGAIGLFAGYIAAYLNPKAPIVTAGALGLIWTSFALVDQVAGGVPPLFLHTPSGLHFAPVAILLLGAVGGGVLRARSASSLNDELVIE